MIAATVFSFQCFSFYYEVVLSTLCYSVHTLHVNQSALFEYTIV
jgi:hypothetical protein